MSVGSVKYKSCKSCRQSSEVGGHEDSPGNGVTLPLFASIAFFAGLVLIALDTVPAAPGRIATEEYGIIVQCLCHILGLMIYYWRCFNYGLGL